MTTSLESVLKPLFYVQHKSLPYECNLLCHYVKKNRVIFRDWRINQNAYSSYVSVHLEPIILIIYMRFCFKMK